jgi:antitoxin (DNA-binding transcriptional repressor) of toxin-antitoxin stability system
MRLPRLLPHRLHRPLHKLMHERLGRSYGPWGYFGCRACDEEWLREHPEDRKYYDEQAGKWRQAAVREHVAAVDRRMDIEELRDNLTATIRLVRAGERVKITHEGEPVALLSPLRHGRLAELIAAGEATPGKPLDRPLRPLPATGPMSASEALERDRDES